MSTMYVRVNEKQLKELEKLAEKNNWEWDDWYGTVQENNLVSINQDDALVQLFGEDDDMSTNSTFEKVKKILSREVLRVGEDKFIVTKLKHGVQIGCTTISNKVAKEVLKYLEWKKNEPKLPSLGDNTIEVDEYDDVVLGDNRLSLTEVEEVAKFAGLV